MKENRTWDATGKSHEPCQHMILWIKLSIELGVYPDLGTSSFDTDGEDNTTVVCSRCGWRYLRSIFDTQIRAVAERDPSAIPLPTFLGSKELVAAACKVLKR